MGATIGYLRCVFTCNTLFNSPTVFFTKTDHSHSVLAASATMGVHPQGQSVSKGQEMADPSEAGGGAGQGGAGSGLVDRLVNIRQEQQRALEQQGMIDMHEEEFVKTVKPLMDSCTKDAIAVRL